MDIALYQRLRAEAKRHARKAADAEDLVQDALLIALEQGRDDDPAWLAGVMRNRAAMQARSAIRRRRRETFVAEDAQIVQNDIDTGDQNATPTRAPTQAIAVVGRLPPAARRVAVLALHGLDAEEIRWILDISETAFRQRLTSIRKALTALAPAQRTEALALAYIREPARSVDLQFGLVRRALKAALHGSGGIDRADSAPGIGTHDTDGHLLIVRGRAHRSMPGGND